MADPQAQQAPAATPPPEIDLSAGFVPKPASQAPPQDIDLSAGFQPKPQGITQSDMDYAAGGPRTGAVATGLSEAGSDIWGTLKHAVTHPVDTVKGMVSQVPPIAAYNAIQESLPAFHAYEDARSKGASITDALTAASQKKTEQDASRQALMQRVEEFKKQPGAATTRALTEAALLASTAFEGGPEVAAAADLGEAAEVAGAESPGVIKQVLQGEKAAQAPAKAAIRTATGAEDDAALLQGNKSIVDQPIQKLYSKERAAYAKLDKDAPGLKDMREKLANTEDQIQQLTDTEEDVAKEAKLEKSRTGLMDKIAESEKQLKAKGIDPREADNAFKQRKAAEDFKKAVINHSSADGQMLNVDGLIQSLKKLRFNKYGDRLEQFLGKDGADGLMEDLQAAKKTGQTALSRQQLAIRLAKYGVPALTGVGGAAVGAYEALK